MGGGGGVAGRRTGPYIVYYMYNNWFLKWFRTSCWAILRLRPRIRVVLQQQLHDGAVALLRGTMQGGVASAKLTTGDPSSGRSCGTLCPLYIYMYLYCNIYVPVSLSEGGGPRHMVGNPI